MSEVVYLNGTDAKIGYPYEHVFADGRRAVVTMEMWSCGEELADDSDLCKVEKGLRARLDKLRKSLWEKAGGIGVVEFRFRPDRICAGFPDLDLYWTRRFGKLTWNMAFGFAMPSVVIGNLNASFNASLQQNDDPKPLAIDYSSITREVSG